MANKSRAMTPEDVKALQELYSVLSNFHQEIKQKAQAADQQHALTVRRYFEKHLAQTSRDLSTIEDRIRRADMALYRKETKALAAELEKETEQNPSS